MTAHTPITAAPDMATIPEWKMSTAEWIAHHERIYGPNWRAVIDRMDREAADAAFHEFFGSEPYDAAPDLTAHNRATVGMTGEAA